MIYESNRIRAQWCLFRWKCARTEPLCSSGVPSGSSVPPPPPVCFPSHQSLMIYMMSVHLATNLVSCFTVLKATSAQYRWRAFPFECKCSLFLPRSDHHVCSFSLSFSFSLTGHTVQPSGHSGLANRKWWSFKERRSFVLASGRHTVQGFSHSMTRSFLSVTLSHKLTLFLVDALLDGRVIKVLLLYSCRVICRSWIWFAEMCGRCVSLCVCLMADKSKWTASLMIRTVKRMLLEEKDAQC